MKNQFTDLKKKVDECAEIIETKKKENAELEEKLKNAEDKCRILEMKYTISSLSNEIICKNNKLFPKDTSKDTPIGYFFNKKNSRNNIKNQAVTMNKAENSTKTAYEIYKSRVVPFSEKQNESKTTLK